MNPKKQKGQVKKRVPPKRKTVASPQALASSFLWHLKPPYNVEGNELHFDRCHWWKHDGCNANLETATYELLRRHPDVEKIHRTQGRSQEGDADPLQWFLLCNGLKSWAALSTSDKQWFRDVLRARYPGKGKDLTPGVFSITAQSVDLTQNINRNASLTLVAELSAEERKVAEEARLDEVGRLAREHHQAGRILIAVAPNFGAVEAAVTLLEECFRRHWQKPDKVGRSRFQDWLSIIAEFEMGEDKLTAKKVRNADLFRRYRQVFKDFRI